MPTSIYTTKSTTPPITKASTPSTSATAATCTSTSLHDNNISCIYDYDFAHVSTQAQVNVNTIFGKNKSCNFSKDLAAPGKKKGFRTVTSHLELLLFPLEVPVLLLLSHPAAAAPPPVMSVRSAVSPGVKTDNLLSLKQQ